jgi:hypothetical protein
MRTFFAGAYTRLERLRDVKDDGGLSILVCLALLPVVGLFFSVSRAPESSILVGQHHAFILAAVVAAAFQMRNFYIRFFLLYWALWQVLLFVLAMGFVIPFAQAQVSLRMLQFVLAGVLLYVLMIRSRFGLETAFNWICGATLAFCGVAILQFAGVDLSSLLIEPIVKTRQAASTEMISFFGCSNYFAAWLAISLPFFFRRRWICGALLIVPLLYLSKTSGAVIPAILGVCFYVGGLRAFAGGLAAGAFYAFAIDGGIFESDRWRMWKTAIDQATFHPLGVIFGLGPGATWGGKGLLHSEYVACLHQFGLVGLAALAGYIVTAGSGVRILGAAMLVACVNLAANHTLHLGPLVLFIVLIAALIERERKPNTEVV